MSAEKEEVYDVIVLGAGGPDQRPLREPRRSRLPGFGEGRTGGTGGRDR